MMIDNDVRRVLIAAGPGANQSLQQLFSAEPFKGWETLEADSFSRARFVLQHDPCDLLLVNDDLLEREGGQGLAWLAQQRETPILCLAGSAPEIFQKAYEQGASVCLPRHMVMAHPLLLITAMEQALKAGALRQNQRQTRSRLLETRQHVDRLVNMIWRTTQRQAEVHWFSQRYMMERLSEELARAERHQVPLTLALGEVQPVENKPDDSGLMPDWTLSAIANGKRRSDVAGQYGMDGFMLLMVHTPVKGGLLCCRRLQQAIEHPQEALPGPHADLHAYFGISGTAAGKMSAASILRCAEQNLEAARADAKERLVVD